jgi:hypothetical protein
MRVHGARPSREVDERLTDVHPYVAENPACRNDFMVWVS